MSTKCIDEESTGNSELDWEIFDVLCKDMNNVSSPITANYDFYHFIGFDIMNIFLHILEIKSNCFKLNMRPK